MKAISINRLSAGAFSLLLIAVDANAINYSQKGKSSALFDDHNTCVLFMNDTGNCEGTELIRFGLDHNNENTVKYCGQYPLAITGDLLSKGSDCLHGETTKCTNIDLHDHCDHLGPFWGTVGRYQVDDDGRVISYLRNDGVWRPLSGKKLVRCAKTGGSTLAIITGALMGGTLGAHVMNKVTNSNGYYRIRVEDDLPNLAPECKPTTTGGAARCDYAIFADASGGTSSQSCRTGKTFNTATGRCELPIATGNQCNEAGECLEDKVMQVVTTGMAVIAQAEELNSGTDESAVTAADRAAMAAGRSLADQGLMAKTIDSTKSAAGAGDLGGTISSMFGGMIGSGSSGGSDNGKNGSNGSSSLNVGDSLGDNKQVIAAIDGGTYQGGKGYTGSLGRDGQGGGGSGYGGRVFGGAGMEGSGSISANGQTPGMDFGGRNPASAGGAGAENAMLGDDPDDYFARINLGENIFKIVEKRYRTKQTGWVLGKPEAAAGLKK